MKTVEGTRSDILGREMAVANMGVGLFAEELTKQGAPVQSVDWRPPAEGAGSALTALARHGSRIDRANDRVLERLQEAHPLVAGIGRAADLIDDLDDHTFLHAGPPVAWEDMCGPLRGAVIGAAIYEGVAEDPEQAARMAGAGEFRFAPCHERGAVGPMAGVVSKSMPMWIVENAARGNRAYATLNEGLGRVLRYGANGPDVIERLRWMERVLAPVLADCIERLEEPLDIRSLLSQALQMGDEGHNRNRAGTSLVLRQLLPVLLSSDLPSADRYEAARFINGNDHFFLNLTMPAGKVTAESAAGIEDSSIVVTMARNGTEFGVRLSGTDGEWYTGPAGIVDGLYLPGFGPEDANPDIGDSTITETIGVGAFAMAAAPAIVSFVGGRAEDALTVTRSMYEITWGESVNYKIPATGFRGTPLGIDCRAVVATGQLPAVNTGIAHREAGVGQVGAGLVEPPMAAFTAAVRGLAERLG